MSSAPSVSLIQGKPVGFDVMRKRFSLSARADRPPSAFGERCSSILPFEAGDDISHSQAENSILVIPYHEVTEVP